jgi:hypothetical protein
MEQRFKTFQLGAGQLEAMDWTVGQRQGETTINTGEMVPIALGGGEKGFTAGEVA